MTNVASAAEEAWMRRALSIADEAAGAGEVPVGAILVDASGVEIAARGNLREASRDPSAHAEMLAMRDACAKRQSWRLEDCTLYVTLEPCAMCAGALVQSRIKRVVYGCADPKAGAVDSLFTIGQDARLSHRFEVTRGVLAEECSKRLTDFFGALRASGKRG